MPSSRGGSVKCLMPGRAKSAKRRLAHSLGRGRQRRAGCCCHRAGDGRALLLRLLLPERRGLGGRAGGRGGLELLLAPTAPAATRRGQAGGGGGGTALTTCHAQLSHTSDNMEVVRSGRPSLLETACSRVTVVHHNKLCGVRLCLDPSTTRVGRVAWTRKARAKLAGSCGDDHGPKQDTAAGHKEPGFLRADRLCGHSRAGRGVTASGG